MPLTRWILYGKIRILQRTGGASPDLPVEISRRKSEELNENAGQIRRKRKEWSYEKRNHEIPEGDPAVRCGA